ncbi:MAG: UTP--glucose-1-phosphate uridylyltransferase GalU [Clostridia bacterium]
MQKITKAVIPAAGFGTRFLPATKSLPKEMFPIVDTPTLQYIVEEAAKSGITDILIILGKNKKCIEDHFDYTVELETLLSSKGKTKELALIKDIANIAHIYYVRQKEMKGSGNAILEAKAFVGNEPFAVLFGDDVVFNEQKPCIGQLIEAYNATGKSIVGCQSVPRAEAVKYGVVKPGKVKGRYTELKGIAEKPAIDELPSTLVSMGRFVFTPDIFELIEQTLPSPNGEIYLTGAIEKQAQSTGVFAYDFEGKRYDIGDKAGYVQASVEYSLRNEELREEMTTYIKALAQKL